MTQSFVFMVLLVAMLACVPLGLKWLRKQSLVGTQGAHSADEASKIISAVAVGPHQRVVTVEVGPHAARVRLTLGVTAQTISLLHSAPLATQALASSSPGASRAKT